MSKLGPEMWTAQAIGATTPLFTALVALLMLCQRESPRVYMSLLPVALGRTAIPHIFTGSDFEATPYFFSLNAGVFVQQDALS